MAIKLLKKSKQRKLLEEVKQTAMGIGQDTSWKDDGKPKNRGFRTSITSTFSAVDEDDLKDLNELRSKKMNQLTPGKMSTAGRKSSTLEVDDTLIDLYRRGVLIQAHQRNPNTFFVYSGDVHEAKKDPALNHALRKVCDLATLFQRLCPNVRPSIGPSFRPFVSHKIHVLRVFFGYV